MKRFFVAAIALLSFVSCNEDFDVTASYKDIPVMYSIVNEGDSAMYIRLERVFASDDLGVSELVQIPDSIYYPDDQISITLENLEKNQDFTFTRVDGSLEGYPREAGLFPATPNYLYKSVAVQASFDVNNEIVLKVFRGEKELTKSVTKIVGPHEVDYNQTGTNLNFTNPTFTFAWRTSDDVVAMGYDVNMIFTYEENDVSNPDTYTTKQVEWALERGAPRKIFNGNPSPISKLDRPSIDFYQYLGNNIPAPQPGQKRRFKHIQFRVDAYGQEILDYRARLQANTGITGTQAIKPYSNLSAGYGVFASVSTFTSSIFNMTVPSREELIDGIYTSQLGFVLQ
jgi:hypothetical protein